MLTLTCALELRAALERATLLTSQQNARSLVEQVVSRRQLCTPSEALACAAAVRLLSVLTSELGCTATSLGIWKPNKSQVLS